MKTGWKIVTGTAVVASLYLAGFRDGQNPPAAGQPPKSVQEAETAKTAILGHVNAVTGLGQGLVVEGGEVLATGGNAAAGAGGAVSSNTVPGAPPK